MLIVRERLAHVEADGRTARGVLVWPQLKFSVPPSPFSTRLVFGHCFSWQLRGAGIVISSPMRYNYIVCYIDIHISPDLSWSELMFAQELYLNNRVRSFPMSPSVSSPDQVSKEPSILAIPFRQHRPAPKSLAYQMAGEAVVAVICGDRIHGVPSGGHWAYAGPPASVGENATWEDVWNGVFAMGVGISAKARGMKQSFGDALDLWHSEPSWEHAEWLLEPWLEADWSFETVALDIFTEGHNALADHRVWAVVRTLADAFSNGWPVGDLEAFIRARLPVDALGGPYQRSDTAALLPELAEPELR